MNVVLVLLLANGLLGAIDTLWYHEYRARLAWRADRYRVELQLHAGRDAVYAVVYGTIGWLEWHGLWSAVLAMLLAGEIVITMADFVIEDRTRSLCAGERILHSLMAIVYGAMLMRLIPEVIDWADQPTALAPGHMVTPTLALLASVFGAGIALSGARDAIAVRTAGPEARRPRERLAGSRMEVALDPGVSAHEP